MDFTRLRLSGFKSFVDASDFRIEPGLTGVVGPNGCGKSNLLEALRWVMGAASAKAMRGEGMDDVIFAGSGARPSRNHAEVTLTIDNAARDAPAALNAEAVLEVTRRIDRGEGSTYRVNGREVRARDVQILFADASTGANSPALVRQGQISELIAAKPQNRRRILEEAAGVSGLYGRRHEAELRLAAAQANLERLDDLARELESGLARLRREARQASRYRALAAEIRTMHATLLQQKWAEARSVAERAQGEEARATGALEAAVRAAAAASTGAVEAETAIRPLRDEEVAASAVLGRLSIEKDRLDRDLERAGAETRRLAAELERIAADDAREAERADDAAAATARLESEILDLRGELDAAPERLPALESAASTAEAARAQADGEVEALAASTAGAQAEERAARARLADAETRLTRVNAALAQARTELASLPAAPTSGNTNERAAEALATARRSVEAAEAARSEAQAAEAETRQAMRAAEDALAEAASEAAALTRLAGAPAVKAFAAVLDQVAPNPGLEAALAAALGDDLAAALDRRAPAFWAGAEASAPAWPKGARPLAELVEVPAQLAARLAFTALVEGADGERLQGALPPGARLVSRQGDLWRWDGFTQRAAAPRPAQARLEQKARLAALRTAIAELEPAAQGARQAHARASGGVTRAETALRDARTTSSPGGDGARQGARGRRTPDAGKRPTRGPGRAAHRDRDPPGGRRRRRRNGRWTRSARRDEPDRPRRYPPGLEAAARAGAGAGAGRPAARARTALDAETRERGGPGATASNRAHRRAGRTLESSRRDRPGAARRPGRANKRSPGGLAGDAARGAGQGARGALSRLLDELGQAQARKAKAADALAVAETARASADREARAAEAAAADAREARAGLAARLEGPANAWPNRPLPWPKPAAWPRSISISISGPRPPPTIRIPAPPRPAWPPWSASATPWARSICAPRTRRPSRARAWPASPPSGRIFPGRWPSCARPSASSMPRAAPASWRRSRSSTATSATCSSPCSRVARPSFGWWSRKTPWRPGWRCSPARPANGWR